MRPLPSAFMTAISDAPFACILNTILFESGDQLGWIAWKSELSVN